MGDQVALYAHLLTGLSKRFLFHNNDFSDDFLCPLNDV